MLSRDVGTWPGGGDVPLPGPPMHPDPDAEAGTAGMPPSSQWEGRQDTLALTGPVGAGDDGYRGRDPEDPAGTVPEGRGMFARLHEGSD